MNQPKRWKGLEISGLSIVGKVELSDDIRGRRHRGECMVQSLGKTCFYCGGTGDTDDHFYPKSKGGSLIVPCYSRCNTMKADKTPEEFMQHLKDMEFKPLKGTLQDYINRITELWRLYTSKGAKHASKYYKPPRSF